MSWKSSLSYKLLFDDKVKKDLKKIDKLWQRKIIDAIKEKLVDNPYCGKKLVGNLSPYFRLRVQDYRVIYEINDKEIIVVVIKIKHRKDIYI
jgi:mRNA interferase RelE/StbE